MLKRVLFWLLWPGLFMYFRASRRARVVLIDGDYNILLVKDRFLLWFNKDQWALPGGGLRRFETPEAGAIRELQEELGVRLHAPKLTLLGRSRISTYGLRYQAYFLLAHVSRTISLRLKTSEVAVAEWHKISTLEAKTLKPEVLEAVRLLRA
ncbi:MAG TPA: NUDIX hydrolase [Candidatus Saccharimonadia bacterium]|nr:NUDIX hydrolase [Candidatus Saccharimonadia bacterium]